MKYLFPLLLLVACSTAQSPVLQESYPIEEAFADEGWTRLERTISTGEPVTFLIPSTWTPQNLKDIGNIDVTINRDLNSTTIIIQQEN